MRERLGKLSPAEFEVMEAVWAEDGETTISSVLERVNAARGAVLLKRTTIQVQLKRLEEKGWLIHREEGRRFFYRATEGRMAASAILASDLAGRVFEGSCAELVRCLFESQEIAPDEIERIRTMIDQTDARAGDGDSSGRGA